MSCRPRHCSAFAGSITAPLLADRFTTAVGRQPWIVQGPMRTSDAASNHAALVMGTALVIFAVAYFVPPAITLREAAAPAQSLGFTLVGALLIIPVILAYTVWSYCVFRGKVRAGEGYH